VAKIKATVHDAKDIAPAARQLENEAMLSALIKKFTEQQQMIAGVTATYQAQINAIREAGQRFQWHESRAYQHGEPMPGPNPGSGPD
jgi:hypothetical protein